MNAILFHEHGGPEVLKQEHLPDPVAQNNQVLVQVKAAALNHLDIWVRKGIPAYKVSLPHVLGSDGSGIVHSMGPEAEGVSEGDRVLILPAMYCGQCHYCQRGKENQCDQFHILGAKEKGTYGDLVLVPDENIIPLPENFSFEEAASFPLAYLTAWHMLMGRAKLSPSDCLLVVGSSSGVGLAAIQIAKWKGARVLALTTNETKKEKVKKAGADEVFLLKDNNTFSQWALDLTKGRGVDVVFEHVGPATWDSSLKSLARYGRLVTCGATTGPSVELDLRYMFGRDLSIFGAKMGTRKEFQELASLVFSGKIKPIIDKIFPFEAASEAHAYLENKHQVGKVLLSSQGS
ncbi:hypothetical protein BVX98_07240 [bacterium F11]|nr:hypothetical protein BVX98_07240 [bacterium F11]